MPRTGGAPERTAAMVRHCGHDVKNSREIVVEGRGCGAGRPRAQAARGMFGPGCRIYFRKDEQELMPGLGCDKSTQKADVTRAQESCKAHQEDDRRGKPK